MSAQPQTMYCPKCGIQIGGVVWASCPKHGVMVPKPIGTAGITLHYQP